MYKYDGLGTSPTYPKLRNSIAVCDQPQDVITLYYMREALDREEAKHLLPPVKPHSLFSKTSWVERYQVDLKSYTHLYHPQANESAAYAYYAACSIKHPPCRSKYAVAGALQRTLDVSYKGKWGLRELYEKKDEISKKKSEWLSAHTPCFMAERAIKKEIKKSLANGNPCLIPCLEEMSPAPQRNHRFYILVDYFLHKKGEEAFIGVKDISKKSSDTLYYTECELLQSAWAYAKQEMPRGKEYFSLLRFE